VVRPKLTRKRFIIFSLVLGVVAAGSVMGTDNYMRALPLYSRFQCADCHVSANPTIASYTLNPFGVDFKANHEKWDGVLAPKDSDGDGFTNGYELGDQDGNGVPEAAFERSNPGDSLSKPNSSVDMKTWSQIKSLFED
jgi:hypothetical protein